MGVMGPSDTRLAVTVVDGNAACAQHLPDLEGRTAREALTARERGRAPRRDDRVEEGYQPTVCPSRGARPGSSPLTVGLGQSRCSLSLTLVAAFRRICVAS